MISSTKRLPFLALVLVILFVGIMPRQALAVRVYLTSGTSWSVPAGWTSGDNTIEVIGGGGGAAWDSSGGGGGGGYSKATNVSLTPSSSVSYSVGTGGAGNAGGSPGGTGGDTYFCNSTSNCASIGGSAVVVGAKGGAGGSTGAGGAGGASASGVGSVKYSGGTGGAGSLAGGGGGGAGGPSGNGVAGSADPNAAGCSALLGGAGGAGDNGSGGAGGAGGCNGSGSNGTAGAEWDPTHGAGGGGGGGAWNYGTYNGGAGGLYGGGGAGGGYAGTGSGAQGLIVITYAPAPGTHSTVTFSGNVLFKSTLNVGGALSKGSGTFVIDHPLDPANMLLYHSFVESPDVKNIYDGIAKLDSVGEAVITLPDYFDALNTSVRYQFFALDKAMPNLHIKEEERNNRFIIGGGVPGGKVSWQVTGIRHDPYILAYPVIVSVLKGPDQIVNIGECIFEPLCK